MTDHYHIALTPSQRKLLMAALSQLSAADLRKMNPDAADPTEARDLLLIELHAAEPKPAPWTATEVCAIKARRPHLTATEIARRAGWAVWAVESALSAS